MIVIADSGSTKTDWLFINKHQRICIETPGIELFLQNSENASKILTDCFLKQDFNSVFEVFFYGSNFEQSTINESVHHILSNLFNRAEIHIENEILGAARSLLGHEKGIACILDTAADSGYYDGQTIAKKIPALGFLLGEGGSRSHLGMLFLKDYCDYEVPGDIKVLFEDELNIDMNEVFRSVFKGEYPLHYLSGLSEFLEKHRNHCYVRNLIKRNFSDFFVSNIKQYNGLQQHKVNFVGSVAYHYSELLEEVAIEKGIPLGKIIEKPMDGLELFHTK
ncbi:hypothetical protein [Maribellus sediminis]|uniref:hypothetical protein n=1 Tax=Maribellus sediminis TaxID=2696285 RepID=UPI00143053AC|nr:hypothetical protein [Maribellus sediminis]